MVFESQGWTRSILRVTFVSLVISALFFSSSCSASIGDRSDEFKNCVNVCVHANCAPYTKDPLPVPIHRRLLLWTCPQECDYTCQHIVTAARVERGDRIVQFHGKWPFVRLFGMQEPLSVLFSVGNLAAHWQGLEQIKSCVSSQYPLQKFYILLAQIGIFTWTFSAIFHTRDFRLTEELDYLAAGASILYGMYYTPIRIFRLDLPTRRRQSIMRIWTVMCVLAYVGHVAYLKLVKWDYGYNMAANVALGVVQNILWTWFSFKRYRDTKRAWAAIPGIVVAWVMLAMSLELLDFPPLWKSLDAHSLWHLGTIFPTMLFYRFLVNDAKEEMFRDGRLKS